MYTFLYNLHFTNYSEMIKLQEGVKAMFVKDIMIRDFPVMTTHQTVGEALQLFTTVQSNIIPVIYPNQKLQGIITKNKMIQALAEFQDFDMLIDSFLNKQPIVVRSTDLISDTRELLLERKIGHAPVVNVHGVTIGLLSTTQILFGYEKHVDLIQARLSISKEWEEKLRSVVELAYDGVVIVDQDGHITMVNEGFCQLYQIDEAHIIGQIIEENFHHLGIEQVLKTGRKVMNVAKLIGETQCLITILPLVHETVITGAVCKITYRDLKSLQEALHRVEQLEKQVSYYQKELHVQKSVNYSFAHIIGESAVIRRVKEEAFAASQSISNVLLLGESGTGKELFASGIHVASERHGKFVQINCAAIPHDLLESELFGYVEGAFTGAKKGGRKGKFEEAQNGTIFLDEIGDMPIILQTKLLRVLQEKAFEPIGSNEAIQLNCKIIAATNQNLQQLVASGKFREDLYYRLNVMPIELPPLRERLEDVPLIVNAFLKKLGQAGFSVQYVTREALEKLMMHEWPGNVRELQNIIERAANLTRSGIIDVVDLPMEVINQGNGTNSVPPPELRVPKNEFKERIRDQEKTLIIEALANANGNKSEASRILGISRTWLYAKMKQYGL